MSRSTAAFRRVPILLLAAAFFPLPLASQTGPEAAPPPRFHAGLSLAVAQPVGEFDDYVDVGGGAMGFFRVSLDEQGIAALRVHAGFLNYGNETKRVCLSETVGCRIEVDLTTSNNIFLLGLGPELGIPLGAARLYGGASIGLSWFSTDSHIEGSSDEDPFASTTNYSDGGFAWTAGGGIEITVAHARQMPISIDFGLSYQGNGKREYLTEGGITDLPDGSIELDVHRSEADFLLWRLGASIGFSPGGAPG